MTSGLSPAVAALAMSQKPKASESDLARIRRKIAEARDLDLQIDDKEKELKKLKADRYEILTKELPTMFDGVKMDHLGLEAEGNLPAYDAKLKPHYKAVLPPKDDPDARQAALDLLTKLKAGDLSTTEVVVAFGRGEEKLLAKLRSFLDKSRMSYTADTGVHWGTLTAWVKERFLIKKPLTQAQLETLGATVGKIVELKKRKES